MVKHIAILNNVKIKCKMEGPKHHVYTVLVFKLKLTKYYI